MIVEPPLTELWQEVKCMAVVADCTAVVVELQGRLPGDTWNAAPAASNCKLLVMSCMAYGTARHCGPDLTAMQQQRHMQWVDIIGTRGQQGADGHRGIWISPVGRPRENTPLSLCPPRARDMDPAGTDPVTSGTTPSACCSSPACL